MSLPAQAELFKESFEGLEFLVKTFVNNNVHNVWMVRQDDVSLLIEEKRTGAINLTLGKSSHRELRTGKVKSETRSLEWGPIRSDNIADINEAKKEALKEFVNNGDTLYNAFVTTFGEDTIRRDER